jgi:hypothetical protein
MNLPSTEIIKYTLNECFTSSKQLCYRGTLDHKRLGSGFGGGKRYPVDESFCRRHIHIHPPPPTQQTHTPENKREKNKVFQFDAFVVGFHHSDVIIERNRYTYTIHYGKSERFLDTYTFGERRTTGVLAMLVVMMMMMCM